MCRDLGKLRKTRFDYSVAWEVSKLLPSRDGSRDSCTSYFGVVTIRQQTSTVVICQIRSGDVRFKPRPCAFVKGVFMLFLQVNARVT